MISIVLTYFFLLRCVNFFPFQIDIYATSKINAFITAVFYLLFNLLFIGLFIYCCDATFFDLFISLSTSRFFPVSSFIFYADENTMHIKTMTSGTPTKSFIENF